jgi:hypothetical protein
MEKNMDAGSIYNVSENSKEKAPFLKKLYKNKGREVSSPGLSKFDFNQFFIFSAFHQCLSKTVRSFYRDYSPGKRGPPSLLS